MWQSVIKQAPGSRLQALGVGAAASRIAVEGHGFSRATTGILIFFYLIPSGARQVTASAVTEARSAEAREESFTAMHPALPAW
jgi:hypothetical protein